MLTTIYTHVFTANVCLAIQIIYGVLRDTFRWSRIKSDILHYLDLAPGRRYRELEWDNDLLMAAQKAAMQSIAALRSEVAELRNKNQQLNTSIDSAIQHAESIEQKIETIQQKPKKPRASRKPKSQPKEANNEQLAQEPAAQSK